MSLFCRPQNIRKLLGGDNKMQLYHHPFDLDSQKVRLALEERGIDYTSYHANPITGKNLDSSFFKMNPSGSLPVFQNGSHIIYKTIDIIQYVLFTTSSFSYHCLGYSEQMFYKRNFMLKIFATLELYQRKLQKEIKILVVHKAAFCIFNHYSLI